MKKNIILSAALTIICLNLFAQENATVNAYVTRNFEKEFSGATNVAWSNHGKGISLAQFRLDDESWVAYFNRQGDLITSGRKIKSSDRLPYKVKESLGTMEDKFEAKYGPLDHGAIFEMISAGGTEYFVPLENGQVALMISFTDAGSSKLERKEIRESAVTTPKSVIAKKD